jgi:hypothetical protein
VYTIADTLSYSLHAATAIGSSLILRPERNAVVRPSKHKMFRMTRCAYCSMHLFKSAPADSVTQSG